MKLVGKRGDYYFYKEEGLLPFLGALPSVQPDHIIAGGAALSLIKESRVKDIDVWVSGEIPSKANKESQYAYNYQRGRGYPNIQYMKIRGSTPSEVLDSFDLDACKCAAYKITTEGYMLCVHKWLNPLVYGEEPQGVCSVNPQAFNELSMIRLHKYANKFNRSPLEMFNSVDYALALQRSRFVNNSIEDISQEIERFTGGQYELLDHLQGLFEPPNRVHGIHRASSMPYATGGIIQGSVASAFDGTTAYLSRTDIPTVDMSQVRTTVNHLHAFLDTL